MTVAASHAPTCEPTCAPAAPSLFTDLAVLTKARLNVLVSVTVVAGAALAPAPALPAAVAAAVGATLAALGACALNQVLERERDRTMTRTASRPLPAGRLGATTATLVAAGLLLAGCATVAAGAGALPALLTALGGALYALVYTPLKPLTPLAFVPGAVAGALPPLVGWTAAGGALDPGALALFGLLLAWQVPHVAAIDWVHGADHARGGLRTLAAVDRTGRATAVAAVAGAEATVLAGAALGVVLGGVVAALVCALLGAPLVALALDLAGARSAPAARRLFAATLVHLPLALAVALAARPA
ncbi:MAG: UbiA family prenyltransferase [Planctomycetes bacterium]|nr:UbiA family prenyltransferase [Planctomycetota bacterium]